MFHHGEKIALEDTGPPYVVISNKPGAFVGVEDEGVFIAYHAAGAQLPSRSILTVISNQ